MIEDGRMLATVDQFGTDMAANAIDMALDVVSTGEQLQGWVKTPIELVTAK
jgi:ribose transport system substrate-binding protein